MVAAAVHLIRATLVVACSTACGRIDFDPRGDGGALGDSSTSSVLDECWPRWRDHTIRFGAARALTEINTGSELDPMLAADQLTLFWVAGASGRDVFTAKRPDRASPFGPATLRDDLSSPGDDNRITMPADELEVILSSTRSGSQSHDLWSATRATTSAPFAMFSQAAFANINTGNPDLDPHVTADGLRLYFAHNTTPGQEIRIASRPDRMSPFGPATKVTELGAVITADPMLSSDELVIVYIGTPVTTTPTRLFYATRASTSDPFGNAQLVPDVNGSQVDGDPFISTDGCELFFSSDRTGNRELYLANAL